MDRMDVMDEAGGAAPGADLREGELPPLTCDLGLGIRGESGNLEV